MKAQPVVKAIAKTVVKQPSLVETEASTSSLVQKSENNMAEAQGNDIIPKIASVITGPGPAATAVGNPRPTAAIAKPIIKKKDGTKPAPAPTQAPPSGSNTTASTETTSTANSTVKAEPVQPKPEVHEAPTNKNATVEQSVNATRAVVNEVYDTAKNTTGSVEQ